MIRVLITGASRGFGLGMTEIYAARPDTQVIACCRNPERAEALQKLAKENAAVRIEALDVTDLSSIEALGNRLGRQPIDILINNAGIFGKSTPATTGFQDQRFGVSDFEADWLAPFRTNAIGPMKMVETLVENVAASQLKKIVISTSVVASISLAQGHMFGYAASKAAANMTARNLAVALKPRGIIVNPIHPGYAKTDMGGAGAHIEVDTAIAGVIEQIDAMTLERTGLFLSYDGQELPW